MKSIREARKGKRKMENWTKTQKKNYVDISKAYLLEVGSAWEKGMIDKTNDNQIWEVRAFFLGEEVYCVIKVFKKEEEARKFLDNLMDRIKFADFLKNKK